MKRFKFIAYAIVVLASLLIVLSGCSFFQAWRPGAVHFVVAGHFQESISYSDDGSRWTGGKTDFEAGVAFNVIAFGNGRFVAVERDGPTWHSEDGLKWEAGGTLGADPVGIAVDGAGRFVVAGMYNQAWYSDDGIGWAAGSGIAGTDMLSDVTYGNGHFVAVGRKTWNSTDGITWSGPFDNGFRGAAFNDSGRIVAVGNATGKVMYSDDNGANWTATTFGETWHGLEAVVYGNNRFVAVGVESVVYCSSDSDGILWDTASIPESEPRCSDIEFGNGRFVAVGEKGIWYSDDGISWATPTGAPEAVFGAAFKP